MELMPVVGRQARGRLPAAGLHRHQRLERIAVQAVHIAALGELVQVLARAEIGQQQ
jgi:hypothetical protein